MANPTATTPGFYSGKDGRVLVGNSDASAFVEMSITKWSGDDSCPMSDRTNSKSGGFQVGTRTIKSMNGSFSCVVPDDATGDPEILTGNTYPLLLIAHDGRGYYFPAYIENITPSSEVTGDLGFDVAFKSNGTIVPWTNVDITSAVLTAANVTGQGTATSGTV